MDIPKRARKGAEATCQGMILHDREQYENAKDKFIISDKILFDVDENTAEISAERYVEALRNKDMLEDRVDRKQYLRSIDWKPVREALVQRASALEIPSQYAELMTESWKKHKLNEDYWSPYLEAQRLSVKTAIGGEYPKKESDGLSGHGPEPAKYLVAIELHDLHTETRNEEAVGIMEEYFEKILRLREGEVSK